MFDELIQVWNETLPMCVQSLKDWVANLGGWTAISTIVVMIMAIFMVVGAIDRICGNKHGYGEQFEEGINAMGPLAMSMAGVVAVANRAIERDKTLTAGIDDKIAKLQEALNKEVTDRTAGDADLQTKIDEINSESVDIVAHPTSVNAKIAKLRDSLVAELHAQDAVKKPLITVSLKQEAGRIKDLAVTSKTDTLMSDVKLAGIDGQVTVGDKTYYVKDLNAIAANDPALVTTQDAWLYGQALMTTVKSDNNQYIKVENNAGRLMIQYEPWAEIHSVNELNALYK